MLSIPSAVFRPAQHLGGIMAVYSGIECHFEKYRARHDVLNPVFGGLITGSGLGIWQNRYLGASSEIYCNRMRHVFCTRASALNHCAFEIALRRTQLRRRDGSRISLHSGWICSIRRTGRGFHGKIRILAGKDGVRHKASGMTRRHETLGARLCPLHSRATLQMHEALTKTPYYK